jgi:hypothetical protein
MKMTTGCRADVVETTSRADFTDPELSLGSPLICSECGSNYVRYGRTEDVCGRFTTMHMFDDMHSELCCIIVTWSASSRFFWAACEGAAVVAGSLPKREPARA